MNYLSHELNIKHATNPQVGDFWHEMMHPCFVVVEVTNFAVVLCDAIHKDEDKYWDFSNLTAYTKDEFLKRYRYKYLNDKDFIPRHEDKFWCDVLPGRHYKLVQKFLNEKVA